ncbi:Ribosome maturation factor RimP [Candidatus Desulfarcum epimagneticum]|uniref:Ribosome maturation factor RimP n=1 Tax=uncultured Desulfobacteraceae bacterium TaxID=218296 RepID=A0A484HFY5_9BACT|nr:Ribosome maturation factor RimP [uncultured Desulfobacteraceae bacterium]
MTNKRRRQKIRGKKTGPRKSGLRNHQEISRRAAGIAEPLCLAEGMELVLTECAGGPGGPVIRVFVDKPDGVSIEDCARISRQLHDLFDVEMEGVMERFGLEVSSPGAHRPLAKAADFERFKGRKAAVRVRGDGGEKRKGPRNKTIKGIIIGAPGNRVEMDVDGVPVAIALDDIVKARLD